MIKFWIFWQWNCRHSFSNGLIDLKFCKSQVLLYCSKSLFEKKMIQKVFLLKNAFSRNSNSAIIWMIKSAILITKSVSKFSFPWIKSFRRKINWSYPNLFRLILAEASRSFIDLLAECAKLISRICKILADFSRINSLSEPNSFRMY